MNARTENREWCEQDLQRLNETAKGDCFAATIYAASTAADCLPPGKIAIVHGYVSGQKHLAGIRYLHAWMEFDDFLVIDCANGKMFVGLRERYYHFGQVRDGEVWRYSVEEALRRAEELDSCGPFEQQAMLYIAKEQPCEPS